MSQTLPIYEIIPILKQKLLETRNLVLQAPPGAGKTTIVPLEVLNESWLEGKKIIMLEPRRLAARAAAMRMADTLGEQVGQTVGYRVRMDNNVSSKTRIEVVTEGVLIRKLQSDPELEDVGLLIFDEYHERSIEADLGLALSLDIQAGLRDDLKILVMSATLDGDRVAKLMEDAPLISSEGRSFPVTYRYLDHKNTRRLEDQVAGIIIKALNEEVGSVLVFLPGAGEIERTRKHLEQRQLGDKILICPLYGMMPFKDQDRAIEPAPQGMRKIVLASDIAETSLTIEGIRIVIDSGLKRNAAYDPRSGMTKLQTGMVSKASAEQRAGRAGRLEEGVCYRLWSEASHRALAPHTEAEIKRADLVPLALDLALWGVDEAASLKWLDVPDNASLSAARQLLYSLGALDNSYRITAHGKRMSQFPMQPRLAHMILKAAELGHVNLALYIAAILEERDILRLSQDQQTADLNLRIEALRHVSRGQGEAARRLGTNIQSAKKLLKQIDLWRRRHKMAKGPVELAMAGTCLALAFPDRVAALRPGHNGAYLLTSGRGARLRDDDPLAGEKYIAIGHLDKGASDARIYLAAPITKEEIEEIFADQIGEQQIIEWDQRAKMVKAENRRMFMRMPLGASRLEKPDPSRVKTELINGIRKMGLASLPWTNKSDALRRRILLAGDNMPDLSDENLMKTLEDWLEPYLENITSYTALQKLELFSILKNMLSWDQQKRLDELVPTHYKVPSGSNIAINYEAAEPSLSVKLQEMFGATVTPTILKGKLPITVHLLSPARRPLQITRDLAGFWKNAYPEIKKEMKGRYPKHPWPDNPLEAPATRKLKPRK